MLATSRQQVQSREQYDHVSQTFTAADIEKELAGRLDGNVNACVECCTRYAESDAVALRCIDENQKLSTYTFAELDARAAQFASCLSSKGIKAGDVVAGLLPRSLELVVTILGTLRLGAVYQPLFTAFGPKSIEYRLSRSHAKYLVTDHENIGKLSTIEHTPTLVVNGRLHGVSAGEDFDSELDARSPVFAPVMRDGNDGMFLLFTSGTTGPAKGVPVPLRALLSFRVYMSYAIDLRPDDVFWNVADPGWAYGLYYGVIGPLLLGCATTLYKGGFSPESTYHVIRQSGVTNLAGSPTAFRMLMAAEKGLLESLSGALRVVSSAGEPLNPEVIRWFDTQLGVTVFDHYGQTEFGMLLCNHHALEHPVHLGSAGLPLPGYGLAVLDDEGTRVSAGTPGTLAVDLIASPVCWFRGYLDRPSSQQFHLTGDTVEMSEDGTISFVGRNDDIITSSGYRIGPFDVESALLEHDAVREAAVVGKPDPQRTEIVKAFVVLSAGVIGDDALIRELQVFVKKRLAAHSYPREIEFLTELPKTPSGKIQRFLLRSQL
jgi:acetyl-CoA synthetase